MEKLATLRQFIEKNLPYDRNRHALMEIVGILESMQKVDSVSVEEIQSAPVKRGRKSVKNAQLEAE